MADKLHSRAPVQGATTEHQANASAALFRQLATIATCRVAVDSEHVEDTEVLAWVEPDEADPAFVSWMNASGALPTHVAIELAGTPAALVAWMVPFDEGDEDADDDLGDEAGEITAKLAALRAAVAEGVEVPPAGAEPLPGFEGLEPKEQLKRFFGAS